MRVEEKTRLFFSAVGLFFSVKVTEAFSHGTDSPVRALSSAFKPVAEIIRASALTISPSFNMSISPGTTISAGILISFEFLITVATGDESFFSALSDFSAFFS